MAKYSQTLNDDSIPDTTDETAVDTQDTSSDSGNDSSGGSFLGIDWSSVTAKVLDSGIDVGTQEAQKALGLTTTPKTNPPAATGTAAKPNTPAVPAVKKPTVPATTTNIFQKIPTWAYGIVGAGAGFLITKKLLWTILIGGGVYAGTSLLMKKVAK